MKKVFWIFGLTILTSAVLIALAVSEEIIKDPVCGMEVEVTEETSRIDGQGGTIDFCAEPCLTKFCENPTAYLTQEELDKLQICAGGVCTDPDCSKAKAAGDVPAVSPCQGGDKQVEEVYDPCEGCEVPCEDDAKEDEEQPE